jgi:hypothetical protein
VGDLLLLLIWLGFAVLCVVLGATQRKWVVVVIGVAMLLAVLAVLSIRTGLLLAGSRVGAGSGLQLQHHAADAGFAGVGTLTVLGEARTARSHHGPRSGPDFGVELAGLEPATSWVRSVGGRSRPVAPVR